jgi:hypothetical protein
MKIQRQKKIKFKKSPQFLKKMRKMILSYLKFKELTDQEIVIEGLSIRRFATSVTVKPKKKRIHNFILPRTLMKTIKLIWARHNKK